MDGKLKERLTAKNKWIRGMYMLLFALIYNIAEIVVGAVAVFQFIVSLFTGKTNEYLITLGQSLGTFIYQIMQFLTFNSEDKPYPFSPWPQGAPEVKQKRPSGEKAKTTKTAKKAKSK